MAVFPDIPGCKIKRSLGQGAAATVYLGIEKKLKRKAAIKVLDPSLMETEVSTSRFEKEAKLAAGLSHSNIVKIFDTGKVGKYHYIIMEYLKGSLRDLMERYPGGIIEAGIALNIVENIMNALDYAHFRGIYHRDIKPDNIMFRKDSTPVLVDFGIAGIFDEDKRDNNRLTITGQSMGSVNYMSPEQCKAQKDIDGRIDIYSLGAVLYEMLSGKKPYEGKTHISIALKQIEAKVPRLPEGLERYQELIDKMMAKEREKRLSSGPEFTKLLEDILMNPDPFISLPVKSPTFQARKASAHLSPKNKVTIKEPLINRFFYLIDPIVHSFTNILRKIFDPFKEYMKSKLQLIDDIPYRYKLVLFFLFIVSIIVLLILVAC